MWGAPKLSRLSRQALPSESTRPSGGPPPPPPPLQASVPKAVASTAWGAEHTLLASTLMEPGNALAEGPWQETDWGGRSLQQDQGRS